MKWWMSNCLGFDFPEFIGVIDAAAEAEMDVMREATVGEPMSKQHSSERKLLSLGSKGVFFEKISDSVWQGFNVISHYKDPYYRP